MLKIPKFETNFIFFISNFIDDSTFLSSEWFIFHFGLEWIDSCLQQSFFILKFIIFCFPFCYVPVLIECNNNGVKLSLCIFFLLYYLFFMCLYVLTFNMHCWEMYRFGEKLSWNFSILYTCFGYYRVGSFLGYTKL